MMTRVAQLIDHPNLHFLRGLSTQAFLYFSFLKNPSCQIERVLDDVR
jgi:hypothetical protein